MTKTPRVHPEELKLYNSQGYRKRIKNTTELIKTLHGDRKLPGKMQQLGANATEQEREAHAKKYAVTADRFTARYWATQASSGMDRRSHRE